MTLGEAIELSKDIGACLKRPSWHYQIFYSEELGYYTTGYNCENCSYISIEDALAQDYEVILPTGKKYED